MLGSSLAVGAVCCARHHLAFTPLRAVLRELFTISVCVALCGPALFCAFIIPGQSSCCLPPVIVMQPRVWRVVFASGGCCPCQRRKVRPQAMHPSLHYFVFMSTCLQCLLVRRFPSECRQSPLPPLPTASTTAATASTTAATASTTAATGVVVAATAAAALPVATAAFATTAALAPLAARLLCHFRPHPPSLPLLSSPFHRRRCRMLECRELLCVT